MQALPYCQVLMFMSLLSALPAVCWGQASFDDRPKISVGGEAVVYVQPDKVVITFGIETWDQDIQAAKQKNNDIQKRAIAAIKETGVAEKEIQTDHLSIEPRYRSEYRKEDFIGYFVRNTLRTTTSDVSQVEALITKVLAAGVTHIHDVDFQTTRFKEHRERAREMALKAAREKAAKMAAALGQSVGVPVAINEGASPWGYYSGWGSNRNSGMFQNAVQSIPAPTDGMADTLALGKIGISASVNVTFLLK